MIIATQITTATVVQNLAAILQELLYAISCPAPASSGGPDFDAPTPSIASDVSSLLASVGFPGGLPTLPITLQLPANLFDGTAGNVECAIDHVTLTGPSDPHFPLTISAGWFASDMMINTPDPGFAHGGRSPPTSTSMTESVAISGATGALLSGMVNVFIAPLTALQVGTSAAPSFLRFSFLVTGMLSVSLDDTLNTLSVSIVPSLDGPGGGAQPLITTYIELAALGLLELLEPDLRPDSVTMLVNAITSALMTGVTVNMGTVIGAVTGGSSVGSSIAGALGQIWNVGLQFQNMFDPTDMAADLEYGTTYAPGTPTSYLDLRVQLDIVPSVLFSEANALVIAQTLRHSTILQWALYMRGTNAEFEADILASSDPVGATRLWQSHMVDDTESPDYGFYVLTHQMIAYVDQGIILAAVQAELGTLNVAGVGTTVADIVVSIDPSFAPVITWNEGSFDPGHSSFGPHITVHPIREDNDSVQTVPRVDIAFHGTISNTPCDIDIGFTATVSLWLGVVPDGQIAILSKVDVSLDSGGVAECIVSGTILGFWFAAAVGRDLTAQYIGDGISGFFLGGAGFLLFSFAYPFAGIGAIGLSASDFDVTDIALGSSPDGFALDTPASLDGSIQSVASIVQIGNLVVPDVDIVVQPQYVLFYSPYVGYTYDGVGLAFDVSTLELEVYGRPTATQVAPAWKVIDPCGDTQVRATIGVEIHGSGSIACVQLIGRSQLFGISLHVDLVDNYAGEGTSGVVFWLTRAEWAELSAGIVAIHDDVWPSALIRTLGGVFVFDNIFELMSLSEADIPDWRLSCASMVDRVAPGIMTGGDPFEIFVDGATVLPSELSALPSTDPASSRWLRGVSDPHSADLVGLVASVSSYRVSSEATGLVPGSTITVLSGGGRSLAELRSE